MGWTYCKEHQHDSEGMETCSRCFFTPARTSLEERGAAYQERAADGSFWVNGERVESPPTATQIGGNHYASMKIQPMEFSMANGFDACQHTIIKYVSRFRSKGGIQDLEKARHTLDMLIQFEKDKVKP